MVLQICKYGEKVLREKSVPVASVTEELRILASDMLETMRKARGVGLAAQQIGAMAAVLHGKVDGILLGGGMVHNPDLVAKITEACSFIAPVTAYPGEFEMEAMASGAIRALKGEEEVLQYTGIPVFQNFDHLKN